MECAKVQRDASLQTLGSLSSQHPAHETTSSRTFPSFSQIREILSLLSK